MNIALDANVVVYAPAGVPETSGAASRDLEDAANRGGVVVLSAPVYAELLALPNSTKSDIDRFIAESKIRVDWNLSEGYWTAAGATYARRRKAQNLDGARRILADFNIGAHSAQIGTLLTADAKVYRTNYPKLNVLALEVESA